MKYYIGCVVLLVGACASITKQEFLQDTQNAEKIAELSQKATLTGCDKIIQLNKFAALDSPTSNDWANIMHIFGIDSKKSDGIDKLYNMNLSVLDKYSCEDIRQEKLDYCDKKYQYYKSGFGNDFCLEYLYEEVPTCYTFEEKHGYKECNFQHDGKSIAKTISEKLHQSYNISEEVDFLLKEFKASELIKARQSVLGTYDGDYCDEPLCTDDTNVVTKLNAAEVLYDYCFSKTYWPQDENDVNMCICYAHETYNKVTYQNLLYIAEKRELPPSKKTEFNKLRDKCENKIKQQNKNADIARYGETTK